MQLPVAGIILAHNHPSGDTHPSAEDLEVSRGGYTSLKEMGAI